MKKDLLTNLENIKLTPEELILINKLNKRLIGLNKKIEDYFNKAETIPYDSIASAFMSASDPESLARKYADIVSGFQKIIKNIRDKYQLDLLKQEKIASPIEEINIVYQINKTLDNINKLHLGRLKQDALNLSVDARKNSIDEKKIKNYEKILNELDIVLQELTVSTITDDSITLDSSIKDLESIKFLETERKPVKIKMDWKQKGIVLTLILTSVIILGVGTWLISI